MGRWAPLQMGTWGFGRAEAAARAGRRPRALLEAPAPPAQPALPGVPRRSGRSGRRSPRVVAGRGVQGALWPSDAGGRSGQGDAGGFAEDPRQRHLGRPAAALRPRPGSAELLRDPRGCGGPGARCGSAGAGPQQQRRPQPLQEREASRRRPGLRRCPSEEAVGSGTTPPGHAEATAAAARGECGAARRGPGLAGLRPRGGPWRQPSSRADGESSRCGSLPHPAAPGPEPFSRCPPGGWRRVRGD